MSLCCGGKSKEAGEEMAVTGLCTVPLYTLHNSTPLRTSQIPTGTASLPPTSTPFHVQQQV